MLTRTARQLILRNPSQYAALRLQAQNFKLTTESEQKQQQQQQNTTAETSSTTTTAGVDELKQAKEKLTKYETDLAELKDKYLRAMAETENTRIRMRKEIDSVKIYGIQGFCKDLLEVADVLNLAIVNTDPNQKKDQQQTASAGDAQLQLQSMHKGLIMTETCLLKIFEKHGLARIMPKEGDKFDPNLHEAIFRIPIEGKESGTVNVLTKIGFKLHERVIRAAQVGVIQ